MYLLASFFISFVIGWYYVAYPVIFLIYSYPMIIIMIIGILAVLASVLGSGLGLVILVGLFAGGGVLLWLFSYAGFFIGRILHANLK